MVQEGLFIVYLDVWDYMLRQPHVSYMEAATIVKGLMEELNSELTMESPGHKRLTS